MAKKRKKTDRKKKTEKKKETQEPTKIQQKHEIHADENHSHNKISLGIHTIMGIVAGYASVMFDTLYSVGIAIVILLVTGYAVEFVLKKKGIKWWMANGGVIYILVWIVTWTFLFNVPA